MIHHIRGIPRRFSAVIPGESPSPKHFEAVIADESELVTIPRFTGFLAPLNYLYIKALPPPFLSNFFLGNRSAQQTNPTPSSQEDMDTVSPSLPWPPAIGPPSSTPIYEYRNAHDQIRS